MADYTLAELKAMYGPDWEKYVFFGPPLVPITKPIINTFNDFDSSAKNIYTQIYNILFKANSNQAVDMWATGSRIDGRWMTEKEAEDFYKAKDMEVMYSDYDFITTAKQIPNESTFNASVSGLGKAAVGVQHGATWKMVKIQP